MGDEAIKVVETQDADVGKLYRKGLQVYGHDNEGNKTGAIAKYGAVLEYIENIPDSDAAVLRRTLRTEPPVHKITLSRITLDEFKVAFDRRDECHSLKEAVFCIDCEGKELGINLYEVFRSLRSLDLRCDNTGTGYAKEIARYIRRNDSLRELILWNSCGGDEGAAALIEAFTENGTIKRFTLANVELSSDTILGFTKMLVSNSTLDLVDLSCVRCSVEKAKLSSLSDQELYASALKRLHITWPEVLISELTVLIRDKACFPIVSTRITSSVDEGVLREFFDAVAADTELRGLTFDFGEETSDALADCIAFLVKRTTTLQEIRNLMRVRRGKERQLIGVLDALKENRSISTFVMNAESVTHEMATSLSELLTANNTLNELHVCKYSKISPEELGVILKALRNNYTVKRLTISVDYDESEGRREMETLLERNVLLERKAAECVISGADIGDEEGVDALKKLHSSAGLVDRVQALTGKTAEVVAKDIQSTLALFSA